MKKSILFIAFVVLSASTAIAQKEKGTTITVTVNHVQSSEGAILFGLYDKATFMVSAPVISAESKIEDGKATVNFENVASGTYAVLCFHDKNGNKTMDFESNGMPIESYGASNNVMTMGPPQWRESSFEVMEEPVTLEIRF